MVLLLLYRPVERSRSFVLLRTYSPSLGSTYLTFRNLLSRFYIYIRTCPAPRDREVTATGLSFGNAPPPSSKLTNI